MSKSKVKQFGLKVTFNSAVQEWHPKVPSKSAVQKWHPKVPSKCAVKKWNQNVSSKVTSKNDLCQSQASYKLNTENQTVKSVINDFLSDFNEGSSLNFSMIRDNCI